MAPLKSIALNSKIGGTTTPQSMQRPMAPAAKAIAKAPMPSGSNGTGGTHFTIPENPYPKKVPKGSGYGV